MATVAEHMMRDLAGIAITATDDQPLVRP